MKCRPSEATEVIHQGSILKVDWDLNDGMKTSQYHAIKWQNGQRPFLNYDKSNKFMRLKQCGIAWKENAILNFSGVAWKETPFSNFSGTAWKNAVFKFSVG